MKSHLKETLLSYNIDIESKWLNPFSGKLTSEATIADVLDKGSGAVILLDGEFFFFFAYQGAQL